MLDISSKATNVQDLCDSAADESDEEMAPLSKPVEITKHYTVQFLIRKPVLIPDPDNPGQTIHGYAPGLSSFLHD